MGRRWGVALVVVLMATLFAFGCGGGDGGSDGSAGADAGEPATEASADSRGSSEPDAASAPAIGKAAFIREGDAICAKGREKVVREGQVIIGVKPPRKRQELERTIVLTVLAPVLETNYDDLSALGIPAGDDVQVEAILDAFQELTDKANNDPEAFVQYLDPSRGIKDPWRGADELAEEYGFRECPRI